MAHSEVVRAFDQISTVYDATRDPLDSGTLDALTARLKERGVHRLLEVGVGTGRVSAPLLARGFEMTGVDASGRMLAYARTKRLPRLVRGDAYHLPFRDRAFDTALFVHVLHLLDDPPAALTEAQRVGAKGAVALVHPPRDPSADEAEFATDPRRIVYRYLATEGYPVPESGMGPRIRERKLLAQLPPDELVILSDREVTEPLAKRIDMLELRGSRHTLHVPPEVLRRAATMARAEVGDRTVTYREVEALATWAQSVPAGTVP